ncbi:hypothetical protein KFJ24_10150 [Marinobacter sediminum]|uniref:hypothetical protein n=1 Tax=Marinobacter sediminum TaxID=256323 RepID=UPI00202FAC98|nr:hypothetical protein [Marinobacter sediminum]MCM0612830.1 hypothetical protein [Marinobacter sediminum]
MNKRKHSIIAAGILASALITATPFALANHHGGEYSGKEHRSNHHGKHDMEQMCEDFREGKGRFDQEERRAKMEARRTEMADRLKLNDEQREIWNQIHEERREKNQSRMEKWQEKLEKRCENMKQ